MSDEEDVDQETFDQRRDVGHEIQAACDVVLAAGLGEDRDAIRARLRDELTRIGHWPQPEPWVEAVIEETQMGHHYRVVGN